MAKNIVGSFSLMKQLNTSLILSMIRRAGKISRAEIAKQTGLSPATVTNITSQLINGGFIVESEQRGASSGGRKPILLQMDRETFSLLSICINSEKVTVVLTDLEVSIQATESFPVLRNATADDVIAQTIRTAEKMLPKHKKLLGIGIALHGLVREDTWVLAPNMGWKDIPLVALFEQQFQCPVYIDNDVRTMAMGEDWFGGAAQYKNFAVLYVGDGIGSSLCINGEIYCGSSQFSGEIGHTTILLDGPTCSCGNRGCLQALASERATIQKSKFNDYSQLVAAYKQGDSEATALLMEQGKYLGIGIANLIQVFNPELVIITGANIVSLGDAFLNGIRSEVQKHCMRHTKDCTPVQYSSIGIRSTLLGAATGLMDMVFHQISETLG